MELSGENVFSQEKYVFPNLILTLPEYLLVSPSTKPVATTENSNDWDDLTNMELKAGEQLGPGIQSLFDNDEFTNLDRNDFLKAMF